MEFLSKEHEDRKAQIGKLEKENIRHLKKEEEIESRLKELEKGSLQMKKTTEVIARKEISSNMELSNLAKGQGNQDLNIILKTLTEKCGITWREGMVDTMYRKKDTLKGLPGNIVIKFFKGTDRDQLLKGMKKKKITNKDLGLEGDNQVFGREMLTREGEDLFYKTLNFKRENRWRFVWIKEGKVFIRKAEGEKCFWIKESGDILKLLV